MSGSLLGQWSEAAGEVVTLPSGTRVRVELPGVSELLLSGVLPSYLRDMVVKVAGEGVEVAALSEEDRARFQQMRDLVTCNAVRAVAPPGHDELEPFRLEPEALPLLPTVDRQALEALAFHIRTPKQVDALSRLALGTIEEDEANRIIEEEAAESIEGWTPFRGLATGAGLSHYRSRVRAASLRPRDHLAPGGRLRSRRRAGAAAPRSGARKSAQAGGG